MIGWTAAQASPAIAERPESPDCPDTPVETFLPRTREEFMYRTLPCIGRSHDQPEAADRMASLAFCMTGLFDVNISCSRIAFFTICEATVNQSGTFHRRAAWDLLKNRCIASPYRLIRGSLRDVPHLLLLNILVVGIARQSWTANGAA